MIKMERDALLNFMYENASENADGIGFLQRLDLRGGKALLKNVYGEYNIESRFTEGDEIDFSVKTIIECGELSLQGLQLMAMLLSKFPEGSQLVFCHGKSEKHCQEILSPYGIKIYENVNINAVAENFTGEAVKDGKCYYCVAVKFSFQLL